MSHGVRFAIGILASVVVVLAVRWSFTSADRPAPYSENRPNPGGDRGETAEDADADGLDDSLEDTLAEKFAPVVYHGEKEVAYPVTVEWWLARTRLSFFDEGHSPQVRVIVPGPLGPRTLIDADIEQEFATPPLRARSRTKSRSFFLDNVAPAFRRGQVNPAEWTTYVHSYSNARGGVTLQYWRAYAWNEARRAGLDFGHGGDWEAIAVHLDASLRPHVVAYLGHTGIAYLDNDVRWEGTHPVVYSEEGSHASAADPGSLVSTRTIRHETWTGGQTTWFSGERYASGGLVNLGERSRPRNGQVFVQYGGLWGEPGRLFLTSGYWGPAFNETAATCRDGTLAYRFMFGYPASKSSCGRIFISAWCDGMTSRVDRSRECYAEVETN